MEKTPPSEEPQQNPQQHTKRKKAQEARLHLFEHKKDRVHAYVKKEWSPKYHRGTATREEILPDGTTRPVKFLKKLGLHPGIDADEALRVVYGQPPTHAQIAHADTYLDRSNVPQPEPYRQAKEEVVAQLYAENPEPFFLTLERFGPQLLADTEINGFVQGWWFAMLDSQVSVEEREAARSNLQRLGSALSEMGSGRTSAPSQKEEEEIVALCRMWLPICQKLKKAFKGLWEIPEYQGSGLYRKEARGRLAEAYSITVEDVETIECSLEQCSRKGRTTTPWKAMLRIVVRKHMMQSDPTQMRGRKTVEAIYQKWLNAHPEHKKKRKPLTTPVAERTASRRQTRCPSVFGNTRRLPE